jgi:diguanylate cyclase (GGDEF)-like protein
MPDTTADGAYRIAERLRVSVQQHFLAARAPGFNGGTTLSIGVAQLGSDAGDTHQFIGTADRALYEAKRLGRNRVFPAGEPSRNPQEVRI